MHRTQITLDDWQYADLKSTAKREGRSISQIVREAVGAYLERRSSRAGLKSIAGIGEDPEVSGRDHDRMLYAMSPSAPAGRDRT